MNVSRVEETLDGLAKPNVVRWYGHVPKKVGDHMLRRALDFKIVGTRGILTMTFYGRLKILNRLDWRRKMISTEKSGEMLLFTKF